MVFGAGGQVGLHLIETASGSGHHMVALTHSDADICDSEAVAAAIAEHAPSVIVNAAAYTAVDKAESDEARAFQVNRDGAAVLAAQAAQANLPLIHISTDYVFSGAQHRPYEIDDETGPLGVYGRTKLAGELTVLAAMPDAHIVRTAWVYEGADGGDFVAVMRRLAARDGPVEVVADQVGSPTYVGDLAGALLQIADDGSIREPVLHAANAGALSRFEQAQAVFEIVGADPDRVRPVGTDQHPHPAPRPAYSALSARRSAEAGLTPLRPWREALAAALAPAGPLPSTP